MIDWFIDLAVSGSSADGLQRVDWFIDSAVIGSLADGLQRAGTAKLPGATLPVQ